MRSACLTMAALLLALLPFAAKGDRLDTLVTQLDRLEPAFWKALAMKSDSDYRRDVEKQLSETVATAREVQKVASRYGSRHPNITTELNKIRTIFQEVEPFPPRITASASNTLLCAITSSSSAKTSRR